ncbi:uncharacterized protein [Branchiostoma lanceolatum]|uniref:uncharacterized protein n=1 Tax=Branchiostoma lanceolatum TaxID=7740 RepID=UPI003456829D
MVSAAAVSCTPPLCSPLGLDPCFKIDVCIQEPLWVVPVTRGDVAVEIVTLCSQLELLCEKEMNEGVSREFLSQDRCRKSLSPTFESHAMVLIGKMREALNRLPQPPAFIQDYLQSTGLAGMFPRAAAYIANPQTLYDLGQQGSMDEHFQHMASLHLVSSMCRQLNSDVNNLANHKYIAHQVALLYQSVNPLGSRGPLAPHEKAIKQNFNNIKQALTVAPDSVDPPRLPPDQAEWMNSLTGSLLTTVSGFPPELRRPMQPVLSFLQNHQ